MTAPLWLKWLFLSTILVLGNCQAPIIRSSIRGRYACPGVLLGITCEVIGEDNLTPVVVEITEPGMTPLSFVFISNMPKVIQLEQFIVSQIFISGPTKQLSATFQSLPSNGFNFSCAILGRTTISQVTVSEIPNSPRILTDTLRAYVVDGDRYAVDVRWQEGEENNSDLDFYEVSVGGVTASRVKETQDILTINGSAPSMVEVNVTTINLCGARSAPASALVSVTSPQIPTSPITSQPTSAGDSSTMTSTPSTSTTAPSTAGICATQRPTSASDKTHICVTTLLILLICNMLVSY